MPTDTINPAYSWYDLSTPDTNYANAVCRWGASLAATSKALAALFARMAEYQLQATHDMARLSRDPARMAQAYADYGSRMVQMQTEMQGSMEKIQREADLLYEELRRSLDDAVSAPMINAVDRAAVAPAMKYGAAASEGVDGPGGWRFDPNQGLPGPDTRPASPMMSHSSAASTTAVSAPASSPTNSAPMWPFMSATLPMPWLYPQAMPDSIAPMPTRYDEMTAGTGSALQTAGAADADVAASLAEARAAQAMIPPLPPAPPSVYPTSCETPDAATSVSYRCDGYRRVARAKL